MDVFSEREGQLFVWDSEKAKLNHSKHGVTFEQAMEVLSEPLTIFEMRVSMKRNGRLQLALIGRRVFCLWFTLCEKWI